MSTFKIRINIYSIIIESMFRIRTPSIFAKGEGMKYVSLRELKDSRMLDPVKEVDYSMSSIDGMLYSPNASGALKETLGKILATYFEDHELIAVEDTQTKKEMAPQSP